MNTRRSFRKCPLVISLIFMVMGLMFMGAVVHAAEDSSSVEGDFVTTETTTIETEYTTLIIDPNVYVVSNVTERVDAVCSALEKCSGLKFSEGRYNEGKISV